MPKLLGHFVAGSIAMTAADLIHVNRNTPTRYFNSSREIIAAKIEDQYPVKGEIELDESYFGGKTKGKRGRGAAEKVHLLGLLKRKGKVHTKVLHITNVC